MDCVQCCVVKKRFYWLVCVFSCSVFVGGIIVGLDGVKKHSRGKGWSSLEQDWVNLQQYLFIPIFLGDYFFQNLVKVISYHAFDLRQHDINSKDNHKINGNLSIETLWWPQFKVSKFVGVILCNRENYNCEWMRFISCWDKTV